ncbi:related to GAD1 - glutamate decarboxylase [Pseudozyma flocculosa]|uniref:Glutamate decarboxylase n=1 Tax=Pseudozyma flocculosa TaxID=84751 RepID=A0A5C3F2H9_9BASI|nr:related to GAD1 - glutamate decarboxylase [Pseudozyma flocculosa]
MSLSKHIDPDELVQQAADHPFVGLVKRPGGHNDRKFYSGVHAGRYTTEPIPKYTLPQRGTSAEATYELLSSELSLDGKPTLNLASFVHTWMPPLATKLVQDTLNMPKEYDENGKRKSAMGVATTGSSEAIMLGCLAAKKRWQHRMKAAGKSFKEPGPNMVFGSNAQVAIEKFARYFDVEERLVPISEKSRYCLDIHKAMDMVDENTICVVVILGSTYTGHYEDVEGMSKLLDEYEKKTGIDIPIHVDGASGAMVAPFATPNLKWSFELPRVKSINTSGHKFGMVYPGLGWILFRSEEMVPKELIFELHYLGSVEYSFGLNFSRPAHPVIGQLFNFINLGFEGYRRVMQGDLQNARLLARALDMSGMYEVLSDIHHPIEGGDPDESKAEHYTPGLPVVSFRWSKAYRERNPNLEQRWVQTLLRAKGWIVPNYGLSPDLEQIDILRVVVRENLSETMVEQLLVDILSITEGLEQDHSLAKLASHGAASSGNHTSKADLDKLDPTEHHPQEKGKSAGHHNVAHDKHHGSLAKGSGVKARGYAKQC